MPNEQQEIDATSAFFIDTNVKLRDIEEKQNLIKDRLILIGENLVAEKEDNKNELAALKARVKFIEDEIERVKLTLQRLIESADGFARKSEVEILRRQFQMFRPLEFARIEDVENIVKKTLKNKNN